MKSLTLSIGGILLAVNILAGLLLSAFEPFNVAFTSMVIIVTTLLIHLLNTMRMKDGFLISLPFIFGFVGFIQYILGIISEPHLQDNGYIIAAVVMAVFEFIILLICNKISKKA